ncbi:MAG: hypothetical protein ACE5OZ_17220 [Candidatus Heimdallarchaeota archaeon]
MRKYYQEEYEIYEEDLIDSVEYVQALAAIRQGKVILLGMVSSDGGDPLPTYIRFNGFGDLSQHGIDEIKFAD